MSSRKTNKRNASNDPVMLVHPRVADIRKPRKDKQVDFLAIEDDDHGGDPYNHTGSHAVPDFGQDA